MKWQVLSTIDENILLQKVQLLKQAIIFVVRILKKMPFNLISVFFFSCLVVRVSIVSIESFPVQSTMSVTIVSCISEFILILFFFTFLSNKSPLKLANRYLSGVFFLLALCNFSLIFLEYILRNHLYGLMALYFPLDRVLAMLIAPGIYFYILTLLKPKIRIPEKQYLFIAFCSLPAVINLIRFALLPSQERVLSIQDDFYLKDRMITLLNILLVIQWIYYFNLCYRKIIMCNCV